MPHVMRILRLQFKEELGLTSFSFSTREQIQGRKARHVLEAFTSFLASGLRSEYSKLLQSTLDGSDL